MNILVVGASLIDLFLRLEESHVKTSGQSIELQLGDKIPTQIDKLTLGGNGANVSVGLARLGINTSFFTWLGDDALSKEIENTILSENVKLLTDSARGKTTGLSVILNFGKDRIILSHHEVGDHNFDHKEETKPDVVYLTSIGDRWEETYKKVLDFCLEKGSILAFSPGTKQIEEFGDIVSSALKKTNYLFVNRQEAEVILKQTGLSGGNIKNIFSNLSSLGPKIISVTDGANGAYSMAENGQIYRISAIPTSSEINRTGAGDAYATGFLAAILQEKEIDQAMAWGASNAYSVMQKVGAQDGLFTGSEILKYLEENPKITAEVLHE